MEAQQKERRRIKKKLNRGGGLHAFREDGTGLLNGPNARRFVDRASSDEW